MNGSESPKPPSSASPQTWSTPENEQWVPTGPTLDVSGKLDGAPPLPAQAPLPLHAPAFAAAMDAAPLELDLPRPIVTSAESLEAGATRSADALDVPYAAPSYRDAPAQRPPRGSGGAYVVTVLGLMVATAFLSYAWMQWRPKGASTAKRELAASRKGGAASTPTALLFIDSEPSGAEVRIAGKVVGTTPLAMDNVFDREPIAFELHLRGYEPFGGHFEGAKDQQVDARLTKRTR